MPALVNVCELEQVSEGVLTKEVFIAQVNHVCAFISESLHTWDDRHFSNSFMSHVFLQCVEQGVFHVYYLSCGMARMSLPCIIDSGQSL